MLRKLRLKQKNGFLIKKHILSEHKFLRSIINADYKETSYSFLIFSWQGFNRALHAYRFKSNVAELLQ